MVLVVCIVLDVVLLLAGAALAWRLPWGGHVRDVLRLVAFAAAAALVAGIALRAAGGFAVLRGFCHVLFCVLLPVAGVRALRLRRTAPRFAVLLLLTVLAGEGCYVVAREVEPFRLEVTTARVTSARLAGLDGPLRVAVVADLQTDAIGAWEAAVFERIAAAEPDLVLFAGDFLHVPDAAAFERELPRLHALLRRLAPPLGCFAVSGDVEGQDGAAAVFAGTAVEVLDDRAVSLPGVPVDVVGLGLMRSRVPRADAGLARRLAAGRFCVVFGHAPDFMRSVLDGGLAADALFVAGHTHGGQVQVPGFGPLLTLSSVPRWLAGGGVFRRGATTLCVSRGIGMERGPAPRIRFWCRPQLILLDLEPPAHGAAGNR